MNIVVFGASGRVGRLVVQRALQQGHSVKAFARTPAKLVESGLSLDADNLEVIQGDIHDADSVSKAIEGQDAVISTVGMTKTSSKNVLTETAEILLPAMKRHGVRRLVSLVGAGVVHPRDGNSVGRRIMRAAMKLMVPAMLADAQRHTDLLMASDLDWTLVRPPRLTDGERKGAYRTGYLTLGIGDEISRLDLADYLVKLAVEGGFEREAPMVGY